MGEPPKQKLRYGEVRSCRHTLGLGDALTTLITPALRSETWEAAPTADQLAAMLELTDDVERPTMLIVSAER